MNLFSPYDPKGWFFPSFSIIMHHTGSLTHKSNPTANHQPDPQWSTATPTERVTSAFYVAGGSSFSRTVDFRKKKKKKLILFLKKKKTN